MDLRTRLNDDLKAAMRAKDTVRTETIRGVRAAILNREVATGATLDDDAILQVIRSLSKQRSDSIEQYAAGGRGDLVEREEHEKALLEAYLPAAPDPAVVDATVQTVIGELGAQGMKDMGRVMKAAKERLGPAVDGKALSAAVKAALTAGLLLVLASLPTLACATARTAPPERWKHRLREAMAAEVENRAQRDEHSRLLADVAAAEVLDGLNKDEIRSILGNGSPCVSARVCSEQGFSADDWYYEIGSETGPDVKQMPVLVLGFTPKGIVNHVWTLTTH